MRLASGLAVNAVWFAFVAWQINDFFNSAARGQSEGFLDDWENTILNGAQSWAEAGIALTLMVWLIDRALASRRASEPQEAPHAH